MPEPNDTNVSASPDKTDTSEQKNEIDEYNWMIRPCEVYKEEYDDCRSISARLHQHFIFGKLLECTQWKTDYHNCYVWTKHKSKKAYDELIASEKNRRMERLRPHYKNDVWSRRDTPPENWNEPLPQWLQDKYEHSYLKYMSEELKNPDVAKKNTANSSCSII
ncbi:UPF0545 protein C22orf39 homolog [Colletes gigas]|uniref:UPF0545 protein C22orf39 homolog n=1 Tax=Colletes gigas TaxID=935657 RepID=UPI001C9A5445|nr:UPF0545 protein C22orf39 homolog [Colletes gigas]